MDTRTLVTGLCGLLLAGVATTGLADKGPTTRKAAGQVELPKPQTEGGMTLNEALAKRRSIRSFTGQPLSRDQVSQICWAAQGITHQGNHRTAPSAGATYPLRVYVALPDGVFLYVPEKNALETVLPDDIRPGIAEHVSKWLASAGAIFVVCGDVSITAAKYHERAERYVWQETGHVAQNVLLEATALGLGATPTGAYDDMAMAQLLRLPKGWQAMYVLPVGVPKNS